MSDRKGCVLPVQRRNKLQHFSSFSNVALVRASGMSIFELSNLTAILSYIYPVSKASNFNINIIPMNFPLRREVHWLLYSTIISRWLYIRDHSRNQTKGGSKRNSPQCSTTTCFFLTILLSLCSQRVQKPLQRTFPNVFCTWLRRNHRVRVGLKSRHNHVFVKKIILFRSKGGLVITTTHS